MSKFISQKLFKILILLIIAAGCQQENNTNLNDINTQKFPDQEGWNSIFTATTNGKKTATIKYGYMRRYNKKKLVYFEEGITVDFFDKEERHTSKLTSNKGKLDEKTNNVDAYENVVVVSDSGITLETEKIWWDNAKEKVISDRFVTITTSEKDTLYGVGFESDQTLTNWTIKEGRGKTDKKFNLNFTKQTVSSNDTTIKKEPQTEVINDSTINEETRNQNVINDLTKKE